MENNLKFLEENPTYYPEIREKLEKVAELLMEGMVNKNHIMKLVFGEEDARKVDTAFPSPYVDSIQEVYPNIRQGNLCYSYVNNRAFGELVNLNDKFCQWLFKTN